MPEAAAAAPVVAEPTKIPPPVAAGPNGAAALVDGDPKLAAAADNPFEFELEVKGQKQKLAFANKDQLKAVLQKALYADQVIKDASQAKKGAEALMLKLKTPEGLREVLSDPEINMDMKKFALGIVTEMMEDERLTPEQKRLRELEKYHEKSESEKKAIEDAAKQTEEQKKTQAAAQQLRGEIIGAMKKYPDIPQTQATMDAVIQNMRAAYRRFGKHLSAEQAMTVYSEQYWTSFASVIEKMEPDAILKRFGKKTLDKIQQLKLQELKDRTDPAKVRPVGDGAVKKKKHITEKEFEKHFQELAGL